jgi:DNA protecting protein DprA
MPSRNPAHSPASLDFHPEMEHAVGVTVSELAGLYALDRVKGFGPQKYKQLHEEGVKPKDVLEDPHILPIGGKRGEKFRAQLSEISSDDRAESLELAKRQISSAHRVGARILTYHSPEYPENVYRSNNPIAVLYVRGNPTVLKEKRVVACVGSRGIRPPYSHLQSDFARAAVKEGFAVASGFALGADSIAHLAARQSGGKTICCMPGGMDRPFPPENRSVWEDFLEYPGAVFVTEFAFGTGASSLTLRKRNKLIVAFAVGVLVGQSSEKGGAMNAYRFGREQKKPLATFKSNGTDDTAGNALIEKERLEGDAIFADFPDEQGYAAWLRTLSSST